MPQTIAHVSLVVDDYDKAIDYYTEVLGFELLEDIDEPEQNKRWVTIAPPHSNGISLVLSKALNAQQQKSIGNQAGGRVFLFLHTDDFSRDYKNYCAKGVKFIREPVQQVYGMVAVFEDIYGNRWDLLQLTEEALVKKGLHTNEPSI